MKAAWIAVLGWGIAGAAAAGPTENAILAAMSLSEQSSYSWVAIVQDEVRSYEIQGKTQRDGCTWVRLPMVKSLARRLGRQAEPHVNAFFKAGMVVIETDDGWQTLQELPSCHEDWDEQGLRARGGMAPISWGVFDPMAVPVIGAAPAPLMPVDSGIYPNARVGVSHPHEELAIIVSSYTSFEVAEDRVAGALSEIGAHLLLARGTMDEARPLAAAGRFQLQIKDGVVVRYTLQLEALLKVGRKKVHVHQTSRTVLKDIGRTTIEVPDAALIKLVD